MRITLPSTQQERPGTARTAGAVPGGLRQWSILCLAVAVACGGPDAHDEAAALRADSSAAGYDVGPLASNPADTGTRTTAPRQASGAESDTARRDTARSVRADSASVPRPATTPVRGPVETAVPPRDTARPILIARVRVNEYLEYNPATRTAYIDIVATRADKVDSSSVAGDTLSFNGSRTGRHSVTVPLGWNIVGQFVNRDPVLAHSAIVIEEVYPLPMVPPPAAFPQAFTRGVEDGLATNVRDEMTFVAGREGRFLIVCGVPGHAEAGQRMQFVVTAEVNVPAYGR